MFKRVLVANRGEIAVRVIRALRALSVSSVAVYSKEDRDALHTRLADERVCIGEGAARNSYLNMDTILTVAKNTGCDAIHPGYGFLSENAHFAKKCEENGITFIGPTAEEECGSAIKKRTLRKISSPHKESPPMPFPMTPCTWKS